MKKIFTSLFIVLGFFEVLLGQNDDLDVSFANNGVQNFSLPKKNTRSTTLIPLENGGFYIAGNSDINRYGALFERGFYVAKFLSNGNLDHTFADNGIFQVLNHGNDRSWLSSALKQPDGKLLIVDGIAEEPALIRIDKYGNYDEGFGAGGQVPIQSGSEVGLQSDGKIVVVGQHYDGYNNNYLLSRYLPNGILDLSFGSGGYSEINITDYRFDLCNALLILPNDEIVLVGNSYSQVYGHGVISKYDPNGNLKTDFGQNGKVIAHLGEEPGYGSFQEVNLLPGNKLLVGGNKTYPGGTAGLGGVKPALVRYNDDGSLDSSFGENGKVVLNAIFNGNDRLTSINVQPDNKILFIGDVGLPYPYFQTYFYVSRLNQDGTVDTTFADDGKFLNNFSCETIIGRDLAIREDGKIMAVGEGRNPNTNHFETLILRFTNKNLSNPSKVIQNRVLVYPNPTASQLHIVSQKPISKLELYNTNGQLLTNENPTKTLGLSNFGPGIYYLNFEFKDGQSLTKKVIKH